MKPVRIQRKRTKGWRMPKNTVYVGRPTKWGNPYRASEKHSPELVVKLFNTLLSKEIAENFPSHWSEDIEELRGKNLACWCPLDQPCHADVLLEIANSTMTITGEGERK